MSDFRTMYTEQVMQVIESELGQDVVSTEIRGAQCRIKTGILCVICTIYDDNSAIVMVSTHHNESQYIAVHTSAITRHIIKAMNIGIKAMMELVQ